MVVPILSLDLSLSLVRGGYSVRPLLSVHAVDFTGWYADRRPSAGLHCVDFAFPYPTVDGLAINTE